MRDIEETSENSQPDDWNHQVLEKISNDAFSGDPVAQFRMGRLFSGSSEIAGKDPKKQFEWYQKAANQGHSGAMNNLALLYENGDGVAQSLDTAFKLYKSAAEDGNVIAQANVARFFENGIGVEKDLKLAFQWFTAASDGGDTYSTYKCAFFLFEGAVCPADKKKSFELFKQTSENGHIHATYLVGYFLENGIGTNKSDECFDWYIKASESGHAGASFKISQCYENGWPTSIDHNKSDLYLNIAAERGHPEAKFRLYERLLKTASSKIERQQAFKLLEESATLGFNNAGYALAKALINGKDCQRDIDRSLLIIEKFLDKGDADFYHLISYASEKIPDGERIKDLFRLTKKAADLFNMFAAEVVSRKYQLGIGTAVNLQEAHRYLSRAVALGDGFFDHRLADYYQNGIGCEADPREAAIIHFHSAFSSNTYSYSSLLSLAEIYNQGLVVAKNYVFAYALTNFSAAANHKASAEFRDELEVKMSPEQIGRAQELSLQWDKLDDIKANKFFPEWLSSKPAFLDLVPESVAKMKQDRERNLNSAKALLNILKNTKGS